MKVFNLKSKYGLLAEKYLDSYQGINFLDKENWALIFWV